MIPTAPNLLTIPVGKHGHISKERERGTERASKRDRERLRDTERIEREETHRRTPILNPMLRNKKEKKVGKFGRGWHIWELKRTSAVGRPTYISNNKKLDECKSNVGLSYK